MQNELKENSKKYDDLEALSILVKNYEEAHYPIEKSIDMLERKKAPKMEHINYKSRP